MERSVSGFSYSQKMERSVSRNFLFPGEAVTGLEVERSVSGNFLFPGDGQIRLGIFLFSGDGKIRFEKFPIPGGRWDGGGKIRLGE